METSKLRQFGFASLCVALFVSPTFRLPHPHRAEIVSLGKRDQNCVTSLIFAFGLSIASLDLLCSIRGNVHLAVRSDRSGGCNHPSSKI